MEENAKMPEQDSYIVRTDIDFSKPDLPWDVTIAAAHGGYVVHVGCFQKVYAPTFQGAETLIKDLSAYLHSPGDAVKDMEHARYSRCREEEVPAVAPGQTIGQCEGRPYP